MYYYLKSEKYLWTVGYGEGKNWQPESDHESPEAAAQRVAWLNGGVADVVDELRAKLAAAEADLDAWRAWAGRVRKFLGTYMSGKVLDALLAAAPTGSVDDDCK